MQNLHKHVKNSCNRDTDLIHYQIHTNQITELLHTALRIVEGSRCIHTPASCVIQYILLMSHDIIL